MSTISRRTFLKLAGVTAVATAGASMLTGCAWFDDVELVIMGSVDDGKTYTEVFSKTMPRILINTVKGNLNLALKLVKEQGPEAYRGADVTVDKDYPNCLTFVKDKETGKESMKKLTQGEIPDVARVLQNMKDSAARSTGDKRTDEGGNPTTERQRRKIYALTEALGWNNDKRRIEGFVKRMTGIDRLEWLNTAQCEKVIEGLKAILAREQRKGAGRDG